LKIIEKADLSYRHAFVWRKVRTPKSNHSG